MANLPSQHPSLSLHLADLTLTPIITSASSPSNLDSLTSLASRAIVSQTAAQRAHLGRPQRIMVEYPDAGAVVLHTYLDPCDAAPASAPTAAAASAGPDAAGPDAADSAGRDDDDDDDDDNNNNHSHSHSDEQDEEDEDERPPSRPEEAAPMLVGVVVAPSSDDAREARRAAARLETVGRDFQREWVSQAVAQRGADAQPD